MCWSHWKVKDEIKKNKCYDINYNWIEEKCLINIVQNVNGYSERIFKWIQPIKKNERKSQMKFNTILMALKKEGLYVSVLVAFIVTFIFASLL